jgi:hypothetical protein
MPTITQPLLISTFFSSQFVSPLQQVSFSFIILAKLVPINFEKV